MASAAEYPSCGFMLARHMRPEACGYAAVAFVRYRPYRSGPVAWEPACPRHVFPTQERRYVGLESDPTGRAL